MANNNEKTRVKNYLLRFFEGKIDAITLGKTSEDFLDYNREQWWELKIIIQDLFKEGFDEELEKIFEEEASSEWKEIYKEISHSLVKLFFSIFDEEIFYQACQLKKQGLKEKEIVHQISPRIFQRINEIASRAKSKLPSDYHKVEKSLAKKMEVIVNIGMKLYKEVSNPSEENEEKIKVQLLKLGKAFHSLGVDEIKIAKHKLKDFMLENLLIIFPIPKTKNSPEIQQVIKTLIKLVDAIGDEELIKESIDLIWKLRNAFLRNPKLFDSEIIHNSDGSITVRRKSPLVILQETRLEKEVKNLLTNLTKHLDKLTDQEVPIDEDYLEDKITELAQKINDEQNESPSKDILTKNLLTSLCINIGSLEDPNDSLKRHKKLLLSLLELRKIMTTTQSRGKWYEDKLLVGCLITGVIMAGVLVTWLFIRSKKKN